MEFKLFHRFEDVAATESLPITQDFYRLLSTLREAARTKTPGWAVYSNFVDYSQICFWAIRKLEYSFIAEAFALRESETRSPLQVLDIGCGVVPMCNWISRRGHNVMAIDPLHTDIDFLVRNDLNAFYDSHVNYLRAAGEFLPFPTGRFDVVTCVSVLEHTVPGNDRIAIREMARVLKPGGYLLITFDVAPPRKPQEGEAPWPRDRRLFAEPFAPDVLRRLVSHMSEVFDVSLADIPAEVGGLTWKDVSAYWGATKSHDSRVDEVRHYLALGGILRRRKTIPAKDEASFLGALLEGQTALSERVSYFSYHAEQRQKALLSLHQANISLKQMLAESQILAQRLWFYVRLSPVYWLRRSPLGRFLAFLLRLLRPKIGTLSQYPPIPLRVETSNRPEPTAEREFPTISLVTPSRNQGSFLERTLKSILDQQYPNLEYVVQDANSSDETPEILARYKARLTHIDEREDAGQANALNLGFAYTTGEIMAYLNSDDILLPGSLYLVGEYFSKHPDIDVVYSHRIVINELDQEIGRWILPPHRDGVLSWADYIPQETLFWRRRIWEKAGSYIDESYRFAIDWELLLRFRDAGAKFARLPHFLGAFRVHEKQKTSSQINGIGAQEMDRLRERVHGRPIHVREAHSHLANYYRMHLIYHYLYRIKFRLSQRRNQPAS